MADKPTKEFGRRRPAPIQPIPHTAPGKRSSQVALLLMGTLAIGGGAAAFLPRASCQPHQPGLATPSGAPTGADCQPNGSSYGGGHGGSSGVWSRSNFYGGESSSNHASSGPSDSAGSVSRGGFGSFARAMSVHFSGGG